MIHKPRIDENAVKKKAKLTACAKLKTIFNINIAKSKTGLRYININNN